jgi:RimJ/RimL family protein N-acetyltransferase/SAM-dependent methyltransferase
VSFKLRPAIIDDVQQIFAWRNDPWIVSLSSSQKQVNWEEHVAWLQNVLTNNQHILLIIEPQLGVGAGIVRLDRIDEYQACITIYLLREFTGKGIGVRAIVEACLHGFILWPIQTIHAHIRNENYPSISAFTKAGFVHIRFPLNCPQKHCEMVLHKPQENLSQEFLSRELDVNQLKSQEYTKRIKTHYLPLIQQYGATFQAVDWGSHQGQANRFRILLEVGSIENATILDVGCGVGHLVEHLTTLNFQGKYLGIDILPEMVSCARESYPSYLFQEGSILDSDNDWKSDYVLGSGLFTFGDRELMEKTIQAMFEICNKAVAFNSLSNWAEKKESGEFYADPLATVQFCRTLTPWVVLRHDYMLHDFTIYVYRETCYK